MTKLGDAWSATFNDHPDDNRPDRPAQRYQLRHKPLQGLHCHSF